MVIPAYSDTEDLGFEYLHMYICIYVEGEVVSGYNPLYVCTRNQSSFGSLNYFFNFLIKFADEAYQSRQSGSNEVTGKNSFHIYFCFTPFIKCSTHYQKMDRSKPQS
jgi:hypothetical protein